MQNNLVTQPSILSTTSTVLGTHTLQILYPISRQLMWFVIIWQPFIYLGFVSGTTKWQMWSICLLYWAQLGLRTALHVFSKVTLSYSLVIHSSNTNISCYFSHKQLLLNCKSPSSRSKCIVMFGAEKFDNLKDKQSRRQLSVELIHWALTSLRE